LLVGFGQFSEFTAPAAIRRDKRRLDRGFTAISELQDKLPARMSNDIQIAFNLTDIVGRWIRNFTYWCIGERKHHDAIFL
jgi:hypothetical protein